MHLSSFTTTKRTLVSKAGGLGPSGSLAKHQPFNCDIIKLLECTKSNHSFSSLSFAGADLGGKYVTKESHYISNIHEMTHLKVTAALLKSDIPLK